MGLIADGRAYIVQRSARRTARYGETLRFAGGDLSGPQRLRVPTRRGFVTVHVHRPDARPDLPVYVHLHGGAFLVRSSEADEAFCRYVAASCEAVVLDVDYDVAPQARYPVAQEQAHDVYAWACTHPRELGADERRVAVGGFGAGGGLAAAVALQARDRGTQQPLLQLLGVPTLDVASDVRSEGGSRGTPRLLDLARRTYFKDRSRRSEPGASPALAEDLTGLCPALVVTAERDALRGTADRYADRLRQAGVDARHHVVPGAEHSFLDGDRQQTRRVMGMLAGAIGDALSGRSGRSP